MTKEEFEAHCAELDRMAKPKRKPTKRQMRWLEAVLGLCEHKIEQETMELQYQYEGMGHA